MTPQLERLRASPLDRLGEAYERLLLEILGVDEVPLQRWAEVYAETSRGLTSDRDEALGAAASGLWGDADHRAVAALVFGQRTVLTLVQILRAYPLPPGPICDVGSGSGAAAVAATICGAGQVTLVDVSAEALRLGHALLARLGVNAAVHVTDLASHRPGGASVLAAHCLNELDGDRDGDAGRLVAGWLRDGVSRVVVLEPGTRDAGQRVQRIRESVITGHTVVAPCTHALACPLESQRRDWCHFEHPSGLGPVASALLRRTGRRVDRRAFSWLVVDGATPTGGASEVEARLLSVRRIGKGKVGATACTSAGVRTLTELVRRGGASALSGLESGNVVRLIDGGLAARGDGERVVSAGSVLLRRQL